MSTFNEDVSVESRKRYRKIGFHHSIHTAFAESLEKLDFQKIFTTNLTLKSKPKNKMFPPKWDTLTFEAIQIYRMKTTGWMITIRVVGTGKSKCFSVPSEILRFFYEV